MAVSNREGIQKSFKDVLEGINQAVDDMELNVEGVGDDQGAQFGNDLQNLTARTNGTLNQTDVSQVLQEFN